MPRNTINWSLSRVRITQLLRLEAIKIELAADHEQTREQLSALERLIEENPEAE